MVEAGAYINALRSSLDILAYALAIRYGVPHPDDCYFPVVRSEKEFLAGGYKGAKFVKGLPKANELKLNLSNLIGEGMNSFGPSIVSTLCGSISACLRRLSDREHLSLWDGVWDQKRLSLSVILSA